MSYIIRKSNVYDVKHIHKLINYYAQKNKMLPRSFNSIYENILGFYVVEKQKKIIGCCCLSVSWEDLAEIKSLAIKEEHQNKGLGSKLVRLCEEEAKKICVKKIFVLTYIPEFFKKLGFKETDKNTLPNKIWKECIECPFFPNCNEIPLIKHLK